MYCLPDSEWVSDRGGRNTPFAGRLGTRAYSAQPQPRWEEGIVLAEQVGNTREFNHFGSRRISIGTRIKEAHRFFNFCLLCLDPGPIALGEG